MNRWLQLGAVVLLVAPLSILARTRSGESLVIYASPDPAWVAKVAEEFKAQTGIPVEWIREGSGVIVQRLKAERARPRATVWFGGTFDAHAEAARLGLLEPFVPKNLGEQRERFQDPLGNHLTTGFYGGILGFAVNRPLLEKLGKPVPRRWDDLLNPTYKGLIAMANPNTSGTAFMILASLVRLKGESGALDYFRRLDQNIAHYTQSGAAPLALVGKGEVAIVVIFLHDATRERLRGFPIEEIIPEDGTGYELGGLSLIKGGPNQEAGKRFIEWVLTPEVQRLGAQTGSFQVPSNTGAPLDQNVIPFERAKLVDLSATWLAENRERLISLWNKQSFSKP